MASAINAPWAARCGHTSVVFDNKMWVIGGYSQVSGNCYNYNDVWYSSDGTVWNQATAAAPWVGRCCHTSVVFDNKMWVIGGEIFTQNSLGDIYYPYNDVWYSSNGKDWIQATAAAPWQKRASHTSVVFDNKIWVIGGFDAELPSEDAPWWYDLNDVWYSSNGKDWTQATAAAPWTKRNGHNSVVFDNKIWIIGGNYESPTHPKPNLLNDVWYSSNGRDWVQVTAAAPWDKRFGHTSVVFDNNIWIFGGMYIDGALSTCFNDILYSSDGADWTQMPAAALWTERYMHTSVVFNDKVWVIGGYGINPSQKFQYFNDVWNAFPFSPDKAINPVPTDGTSSVSLNPSALSWADGSGFFNAATSYDVYFGTTNPPPFIGNQTSTIFPIQPGALGYGQTSFWRIDSKNVNGTTTGDVWSFSTVQDPNATPTPTPTPTSTPTPTTTPTPDIVYDPDDLGTLGHDGWVYNDQASREFGPNANLTTVSQLTTSRGIGFTGLASFPSGKTQGFSSWEHIGNGIILAPAANMAGKIYRAKIKMTGNASTPLLCPSYRILFLSTGFAHVGGLQVTTTGGTTDTHSAVNMPSASTPDGVEARLYWGIPTSVNQYGNYQKAATVAAPEDKRSYYMTFDVMQAEAGDVGTITMENIVIEKIPRPDDTAAAIKWGSGVTGARAFNETETKWSGTGKDVGTGWDIGVAGVSATTVTMRMQTDKTSVFCQVNPLTREDAGYPALVSNKLIRVTYNLASSNVETCPQIRMFVIPWVVPLGTLKMGNVLWGEGLDPSVWRNWYPQSSGLGLAGSPKKTGSVLETYVYTMNAPTEMSEQCILTPLVDIDQNNVTAFPINGWTKPSATVTISGCSMEILSSN